jgi:cell division protein FtsQ
MDGQRRVTRQVKHMQQSHNPHFKPDISLTFRRTARLGALLVMAFALGHGISVSGQVEGASNPFRNWQGKLAGLVGLAADNIQIAGIEHHDAKQVLSAIAVKPGGSLVGFDAETARRQLAKLDWIENAAVERVFPNQLIINLVERQAFAIWQNDGNFAVVDKSGTVMTGVSPSSYKGLPLVTGAGANLVVADLVNQMEATPDLRAKVRAAARVGQRRWTLYLDNGVKIALPETHVQEALAKVAALDQSQGLLSKGITQLDLRVANEMVVALAVIEQGPADKGKATVGR